MAKRKLKKFADNKRNPLVHQYPYGKLREIGCCPVRGVWHRDVFRNDYPITLELGCGKGEYSVALAQAYETRNYIGVDKKGARIWTGASQALRLGMTNVAFLRADIRWLSEIFAPNEVDEIWLTFPDPQMKKTKGRLLSALFLQEYTRFLKPHGVIHLKTDSLFLYTYTLWLLEANDITPLIAIEDLYAQEQSAVPNILTHYEKQWLLRGKSIKYLRFELPHGVTFLEPEHEPEHDDYVAWSRPDPGLMQEVENKMNQLLQSR